LEQNIAGFEINKNDKKPLLFGIMRQKAQALINEAKRYERNL